MRARPAAAATYYYVKVEKREFQTNGRNWGEVEMSGNSVSFAVDGKATFNVDCADVAAASVQKNEVRARLSPPPFIVCNF